MKDLQVHKSSWKMYTSKLFNLTALNVPFKDNTPDVLPFPRQSPGCPSTHLPSSLPFTDALVFRAGADRIPLLGQGTRPFGSELPQALS